MSNSTSISPWLPASLASVLMLLNSLPPDAAQAQQADQPASMKYPIAVVAMEDGALFVADRHLPGIWKVAEGKRTVFFQASKKFRTPLNAIRCLAFDAEGFLLAGDSATREVYRFDKQGEPEPLTGGKIGIPMGIAVSSTGDIYVSDLEIHRIWKIPAAGGDPEIFAEVAAPIGLAMDAEDRLWVVSRSQQQLLRFTAEKQRQVVVDDRPFEFPHHVVLDEQTAYVTDGYAKAVWKIPADGEPEKWATSPAFSNPVGLAWQGKDLVVADPRSESLLLRVTSEGEVSALAP